MRAAVFTALLIAAAPVMAQQTTLGYDAFIGGAKVGAAEVKINTEDARYEISGRAWAVGFFNLVTQWQGVFSSTGRIADRGPVNDGYRYIERTRNKVKELTLSDGQLTYVKNGHVRSPRAPTSLDLLSTLFVSRNCASAGAKVHNGKDQFSLRLTGQQTVSSSNNDATERCTFVVSNPDNERIDATVWLEHIDGLTVPVRLDLAGALVGSLRLQSAAPGDSSAEPRDPTIQI